MSNLETIKENILGKRAFNKFQEWNTAKKQKVEEGEKEKKESEEKDPNKERLNFLSNILDETNPMSSFYAPTSPSYDTKEEEEEEKEKEVTRCGICNEPKDASELKECQHNISNRCSQLGIKICDICIDFVHEEWELELEAEPDGVMCADCYNYHKDYLSDLSDQESVLAQEKDSTPDSLGPRLTAKSEELAQ